MSFILSGLSTEISLKETVYCAIVSAILGHLSFFLYKESPSQIGSLERAVQIYKQSATCDTSVKEAIEKVFEITSIFGIYVQYDTLASHAVHIAKNNLISRK
ncbi:hypothetical protein BYT27DRAFT_7196353 [Phlegmacium glaucopus]|nr:hypothetical protein BYT27DRAFT_7196353 [Phlegmacium glaucopus]